MISTTDFKKGLKIEIDGEPCMIVDFQHFKPGKGGAFMKTKWKNLLTGAVVERNFRSGVKFNRPDMETRTLQYLYHDGTGYVFMDLTTYEQLTVDEDLLDQQGPFLKESQEYKVLIYQGRPLDLELPVAEILEVTETDPGMKGDTVSNTTKPAILETGLVVNVPLFINIGDRLKIDTRSREYLGRE
ncbi:MAG: elongation factor P [Deltaproteobacteria bacterium]|nr:elongation factor P [Deltaproteobacteria bacterium]